MTRRSLQVAPFVFLGILSLYGVFRGPTSLSFGDDIRESSTGLPASARTVVVLVIDFSKNGGKVLDENNLEMMRDLEQRLFDSHWVLSYS